MYTIVHPNFAIDQNIDNKFRRNFDQMVQIEMEKLTQPLDEIERRALAIETVFINKENLKLKTKLEAAERNREKFEEEVQYQMTKTTNVDEYDRRRLAEETVRRKKEEKRLTKLKVDLDTWKRCQKKKRKNLRKQCLKRCYILSLRKRREEMKKSEAKDTLASWGIRFSF